MVVVDINIEKRGKWITRSKIDDMSIWWSNKRSNVVIFNTTEFYKIYPDLNKLNSKKLGFRVTTSRFYSTPGSDIEIGVFDNLKEAFNIAIDIMIENPNGFEAS